MGNICRQILAIFLVIALIASNVNLSVWADSNASDRVQSSADAGTEEDHGQMSENANVKEEENTGEKEEDQKNMDQPQMIEDQNELENTGGTYKEVQTEDSDEGTSDQDEEVREKDPEESGYQPEIRVPEEEPVSVEEPYLFMPMSLAGTHDTPMPKITRRYFTIQKKSKKVSQASGKNLKVVANEKAACNYVANNYGDAYNFTPRFTSSTKVTVGGGNNGAVTLAKVKKSEYDVYGKVYDQVMKNHIQTKVFNLNKCTSNPYAIYSNVGTWYDVSTKKIYDVDIKMTITGYKFPDAGIRKKLNNTKLKAPFIEFHNGGIGIVAMGTDYVQTKMEFCYGGTQTPIPNIKGMVQFADIDAQQGVDFGAGFQKVVMFNVGGSHLQYNSAGIMSGSLGYVSSRTKEALFSDNKILTTAVGIFSGPSVNCRWTLAKCDHKDTGGNGKAADYYAPNGYGIPADSTQEDAVSYYYSNSTGYIYVENEVGILALPSDAEKNIYEGNTDGNKSLTQDASIAIGDRGRVFTYIVSAIAAPGNVKLASYSSFRFTDTISEYLNVRKIKVYASNTVKTNTQAVSMSDVTSWFAVRMAVNGAGKTVVTANASEDALSSNKFYGRGYYLHIETDINRMKNCLIWGSR